MKKILVLVLCLVCFMNLFAKINDNLEIIKEEDKAKIIKKMNEIQEKKKVNIFVNTSIIGEGFQVEAPERVIIFNLKKSEGVKDKYEVELSFSRDFELEEQDNENIDLLLNNTEIILQKGDIGRYFYEILDSIDLLLEKIKIEEPLEVEAPESGRTKFFKQIVILAWLVLLSFPIYKLLKYFNEKNNSYKNND